MFCLITKLKMPGVWWALKSYFSKKIAFSESARPPKSQKTFSQLLQKSHFNFQKMLVQLLNCPLVLLKTQFYSLEPLKTIMSKQITPYSIRQNYYLFIYLFWMRQKHY